MPISTAFTNQAKQDFLNGVHTSGHTYKILLIKSGASGTYDKNTTGVGTPGTGAPSTSNVGTDEVAASGTYAAGGASLAGRAVSLSTDTAVLTFSGPVSFTSATLSAIGAVIYNDSVAGKPAIATLSFGGTVASTNGTFSITIPTADASTGLIRIA